MKNFKEYIIEKMRKNPREEELRLQTRVERTKRSIPSFSLSKDELKLAAVYDKSRLSPEERKKHFLVIKKLGKQYALEGQLRNLQSALEKIRNQKA